MSFESHVALDKIVRRHRLGTFLVAELLVVLAYLVLKTLDFDLVLPGLGQPKNALNSLFFAGMLGLWGYSAFRRITNPHIALLVAISAALLVLFVVVQRIRYWTPVELTLTSRLLWYMYYVTMVFVPSLGYLAARHMGKTDDYAPPERPAVLAVSALLCLGILTNDLHYLAFTFNPLDDWNRDYSYGPVYFLAAAWMAAMSLGMVACLGRGCSVPSGRRRAWMPLLSALLFALYCLAYPTLQTKPFPLDLDIMSAFCICAVTLWESCIQVGLIPSNQDYIALFDSSTVGMHILDERGATVTSSKAAPPLDHGDLHLAEHGEEPIRAGWRLRQAPIPDGQVVWYEDVRRIEDVHERLFQLQGTLTEENNLLQSENSLASKQARIDAKNVVYERIELDTDEVLREFETLLAQSRENPQRRRETLRRACLLGAYLKRKANLAIIGQSAREIPVAELVLCLKEVSDNLAVYGAQCSVSRPPAGAITCENASKVLDAFFSEVSGVALGLESLLTVVASVEGGPLLVKMTHEGGRGSGFSRIVLADGEVRVERSFSNWEEGGRDGVA